MKEVVELASFDDLVRHIQTEAQFLGATAENVEVKPYCFDGRIGWDTYIVTVNGAGWGFTNGPVSKPTQLTGD